MTWKDFIPQFMSQKWDAIYKKMEGTLVYFTPAYVSKQNSLFSPLIALIAVIWVIVLAGLALSSFFALISSLLVLYFILTKVFGIHLDAGDVFAI